MISTRISLFGIALTGLPAWNLDRRVSAGDLPHREHCAGPQKPGSRTFEVAQGAGEW